MNENEFIADRLEEIIGRMFAHSGSLDPRATEYSIFYDPRKHGSWFILIFFANKNQLKEGIKSGVCYQLYSYLRNELDKVTEFSKVERRIFFESGNRPVDKSDVDNLFRLLINKQEILDRTPNQDNIEKCGSCGHDFEKHQLLCSLDENNDSPTEGWIMCPEENCTCFQTWGAAYKTPNE